MTLVERLREAVAQGKGPSGYASMRGSLMAEAVEAIEKAERLMEAVEASGGHSFPFIASDGQPAVSVARKHYGDCPLCAALKDFRNDAVARTAQ